jgi:hypothetical protein
MNLSQHPLARLLDAASEHLSAHLLRKKEATPAGVTAPSYSGIIFSGNPHETVPRRLLLDDRLTPLERNAWQVFRLLINGDGLTAFPTYDQLRPYLGMQPGKPASRETISKALITLRLTRWLSLGRRVRSDLSGQVQGNVYLLHDEPVTPAEAIELDKDYLKLLVHALNHQSKVIREVAQIAWREFAADPDVGHRLPSRLGVIEDRLNEQSWARDLAPVVPHEGQFGSRTQPRTPEFPLSSDAELSADSATETNFYPSSASELSGKSRSTASVRNPNSNSTYTNTNKYVCKKLVHTPPDSPETSADFLAAVHRLPVNQKHQALQALQKVPENLKPTLIKQWTHRCDSGAVRNPFGYLMTLVEKAIRGNFNGEWSPDEKSAAQNMDASQASPKRAQVGRKPESSPSARVAHTPPSEELIKTANHQLGEMMRLLRAGRGGGNERNT